MVLTGTPVVYTFELATAGVANAAYTIQIMTEITTEVLEQAIAGIVDPHTGQPLDGARTLRDFSIAERTLRVNLALSYPALSWHSELTNMLCAALAQGFDGEIAVDVRCEVSSRSVQKGVALLPEVKNTIAVASGKGGVGKSTTAVNLALALQAEGACVGVLDADIYGPSQPRMLGCQGQPDSPDGKAIVPKSGYGMQNMSIGYLIEEDTPMIWRGPMVTSALEQMLRDTRWEALDYLVIDLPPGTGDIQLTLCQKIPLSGALIVTTPQDIALIDAKKAYKMFDKVSVATLGIVENMSGYVCSQCGHQEAIFGSGGGDAMAEEYGLELLGSLPLDPAIRSGADSGRPTVAADPDSEVARIYRTIARRAAGRLALRTRDYSSRFPRIVVENS